MKYWTVRFTCDHIRATIIIDGVTGDDSYAAIANAELFVHHTPLIRWKATAEEIK